MSAENQGGTNGPNLEVASPESQKQKVSLANEGVESRLSPHGHFSRKTSANSEHSVDQHGPVRRKSILHNAAHHDHHSGHHLNYGYHSTEDDKHWNGDVHYDKLHRPPSRAQSFASEKSKMDEDATIVNSWWYLFCLKCRQKEKTASWEPPHWQKICPYPFCPSYRQFARLLALILVGFLLWGIVFSILGKTAAPGGQLFGLALLCICANFGGWLATLLTLPALVGMLAVGVLFQNVGLFHLDESYKGVCSELRKVALVIILIRAGLDLEPNALKRLYLTVMKLGLVPWIVECSIIAIMTYFLMGLPWKWGFLLGSAIAAISPAVVVPCLLRLRSKGYGIAKGIPTLIIAISGIDDAASVAIFGIIHGLIASSESLVFNIIQGPVSVVLGIGFGIFWGFLSKFVPEKDDVSTCTVPEIGKFCSKCGGGSSNSSSTSTSCSADHFEFFYSLRTFHNLEHNVIRARVIMPFVVPLRILLLFGGGLIAILGSEKMEFGGAGPLACVTAAFISSLFWGKQGWDIEDNPAATAFEIFWMIFEPILFGITGTDIKINEMDPEKVKIGLLCLVAGIVIRMVVTVLISFGDRLNLKEKLFVGLALMAKATVQAALSSVALDTIRNSKEPSKEEEEYAEIVLLVCILSIVLTAPLGAVLITLTGPRLLTKTSSPPSLPEWRRRSHRPSIRDISIIDEEEELENNSSGLNKLPRMLEESEVVEVQKKEALSMSEESEDKDNRS